MEPKNILVERMSDLFALEGAKRSLIPYYLGKKYLNIEYEEISEIQEEVRHMISLIDQYYYEKKQIDNMYFERIEHLLQRLLDMGLEDTLPTYSVLMINVAISIITSNESVLDLDDRNEALRHLIDNYGGMMLLLDYLHNYNGEVFDLLSLSQHKFVFYNHENDFLDKLLNKLTDSEFEACLQYCQSQIENDKYDTDKIKKYL
ncbi:hypothetical protein [Deinococcus cellulosilyticus]|uniref:Uncharacterized protein n=1 Tax=Deinococcus cellulosilyticus (strain DSM 18568 / NBRC 106333 / KACC 11606 / 5516J-15) TaxID=1223518 RepID=A0A511NB85_DEIC1|nr:hypothetical protein [Deinococcus cellulosilyticus]GEM50064.1 hypothetical protein DC3_56990 [Deinococcus cellulosilyticus NBRC 106333 = KACC 11606]